MALAVGEAAPDFTSTSSTGETISLAAYKGKKNVVLFFYPGDFTPVCTKEVCGFRDIYDELQGKDTEIIGVSVDSGESHEKFSKVHNLGFPLLSDTDKVLAKKYEASTGLLSTLIGRVSRITYVIDKNGKIAAVLKGELSADKHVDGVKNVLSKLA
jgi:thioredoxin-dependent peroxiredoxin